MVGVVLGMRAKRDVGVRVRALYALASACEQMAQSIAYAKTPPKTLIRRLKEQDDAAEPFFAAVDTALRQGLSPEAAWTYACERTESALCLLKNECTELKSVGIALAEMHAAACEQVLKTSAALFLQWAKAAETAQKNEERLRLTLWVTAALLTAILLL
ncbi:MAG: hypothetical protein IKU55_05725 [Clostridia bacterium]|nr:hypothetical protein [Clostridia bacterium]